MTSAVPEAAGRLLGGRIEGPAQSLAEHQALLGPTLVGRARTRDLLDEVQRSGLCGCGGGGFPVAAKWGSVLSAGSSSSSLALVLANGAEAEPASVKDAWLLQHRPHLVLDGAELAAAQVGAPEAVLVVSEAARASRAAVEAALAERGPSRRAGVRVRLVTCPDRYVSSEESALVALLEGRAPLPTSRRERPAQRGVRGRPTLVQNVETLAHVALIARWGAEWFREAGTLASPGTRLLTVSGAASMPGVVEAAFDQTMGEVLERAGARLEDTRAVLVGGYFGCWVRAEAAWELDLSAASLRELGLGLGAGVLVALPRDTCPVLESTRLLRWLAAQSAGQCGPCVHGLAAVAETMGQLHERRASPAALGRLERWGSEIIGRGACRLPDGAVGLLRSFLTVFSSHISRHLGGQCGLAGPTVCPLPESVAA